MVSRLMGNIPPPSHKVGSAIDPKCHALLHNALQPKASPDAGSAAVITYGSSFGYVATAWAKRVPYYVQHLYEDHMYRDPTAIGGAAVPLQDR